MGRIKGKPTKAWLFCEVCNVQRPRDKYRVNARLPDGRPGKVPTTICQPCRVVQRNLDREEHRRQQALLQAQVHLCVVCTKNPVSYKSRTGRCYRCAMDAQIGLVARTGEKAPYARKAGVRDRRVHAKRPSTGSSPTPPKPPSPKQPRSLAPRQDRLMRPSTFGPHGPNALSTPAQIKQRAAAKAAPERYFQVSDDEWWLLAFECQTKKCSRRMVAAGKCFTCSTGRPRSEKYMSKYERGSAHDDNQQNDANQAA